MPVLKKTSEVTLTTVSLGSAVVLDFVFHWFCTNIYSKPPKLPVLPLKRSSGWNFSPALTSICVCVCIKQIILNADSNQLPQYNSPADD